MWATGLHLLIGNLIIGFIEGGLLGEFFKCSMRKAVWCMIATNYVSAWGGTFLTNYLINLGDLNIENIRIWLIISIFIAFIITLLIELPFVHLAMRGHQRPFLQSVRALVVINLISYAFLACWYFAASETSMITDFDVVSLEEMAPPKNFSLYYITSDGKKVCRMALDNTKSIQELASIETHQFAERLFVRPPRENIYNLYLSFQSPNHRIASEQLILNDFSPEAPVDRQIEDGNVLEPNNTWFNFGHVPLIGTKSNWTFSTAFWPNDGMRGSNSLTHQQIKIAMELPIAFWQVRNATHITGDFVIAQIGHDQICLIHPDTQKMALITQGYGPIVAKSK